MLNKIIASLVVIIILMIAIFTFVFFSFQSDNNNSTKLTLTAPEGVKPITSGTSQDPLVIALKDFYWDGTRYIGTFKVTNNTDHMIYRFIFPVEYVYSHLGIDDGGGSTIAICDGWVAPARKTVELDAYFHEGKAEDTGTRKLTSISTPSFTVKINGIDQEMNLDDLKKRVNSKNINNQSEVLAEKKATEVFNLEPPINSNINVQSVKITEEEAIRLLNKIPKNDNIIKVSYKIFSQKETTMKLPPQEEYFIFLPTFHESDGYLTNGDTLYCVDKYDGKVYTFSSTGLKTIK